MKFTPTPEFKALQQAAAKVFIRRVFVRTVDDLNIPLSSSGWTELTEYVISLPSIGTRIEVDHGQFQADSVNIVLSDIKHITTTILETANKFIEIKIVGRLGSSGGGLAADEVILFSGFVDPIEGVERSESRDTVTLSVMSYDDFANRISAERLVTQHTVETDEGDALLLQNIPGVYILDANITGFELSRGFHSIQYNIEESGERSVRLDEGRWVEIPSSPVQGALTLGNAGEGEEANDGMRVKIYYDRTEQLIQLPLVNERRDPATQQLVQVQRGDTLPHLWFQRTWVFTLMQRLTEMAGGVEFDFDNFRVNTHDGRRETSYYEIPPGEGLTGKTRAINLVGDNLYIGTRDKVYARHMINHTYTELLTVATGFVVVRIMREIIGSHNELIVLAREEVNPTTVNYRLYLIDLTAGTSNGWALSNRGTTHDGPAGMQNFAWVPDPQNANDRGFVFYLGSNGDAYYFNLETKAEVATALQPNGALDLAGWSDGESYFAQGRISGGVELFKIFWDAGIPGWWINSLATLTDEIEQGIYNPNEDRFLCSLVASGGLGFNLLSYNHSTDNFTTILTAVNTGNFDYRDNKVYFLHGDSAGLIPGEVQNNSASLLGDPLRTPFPEEGAGGPHAMQFDTERSAFYGIFNKTSLLYQYATHISMFLEYEADFSGMSVRDAIINLARAYNISINLNATKKWIANRRIDDAGNIITSGETVVLDADGARDIAENMLHGIGYAYVFLDNDRDSVSYDGTIFVDGGVFTFADDMPVRITRNYLPTYLLRDFAFYYFKYFNRPRKIYRIPGANNHLLEWEPFDGALLQFSNRRLALDNVHGVIVGTNIHETGNVDIDVMVLEDAA